MRNINLFKCTALLASIACLGYFSSCEKKYDTAWTAKDERLCEPWYESPLLTDTVYDTLADTTPIWNVPKDDILLGEEALKDAVRDYLWEEKIHTKTVQITKTPDSLMKACYSPNCFCRTGRRIVVEFPEKDTSKIAEHLFQ